MSRDWVNLLVSGKGGWFSLTKREGKYYLKRFTCLLAGRFSVKVIKNVLDKMVEDKISPKIRRFFLTFILFYKKLTSEIMKKVSENFNMADPELKKRIT